MLIVSTRSRRLAAATASVVCAGAVLAPPASAVEPEVVASGLNNPRQLSFTGDTLYVAEAGTGGDGTCVPGPEGEDVCFGLSGSITRVRGDVQTRVLTGLASMAAPGGDGAIGPADVLVTGQNKYVVTNGLGADPAVREEIEQDGAHLLGTVLSGAFPNAGPRVAADIGAYEAAVDPDGGVPDTNPTGIIARGGGYVLTDSGGNSLLRVQGGHVSTIAVFDSPGTAPVPFPPFEIDVQPVPTSVAVGPDGAYYVSELTGFPFVPGFARIHRVVPGQAPTVYAEGLTNVTDLAWHEGELYAVQIGILQGGPGSLVRVDPAGGHETVLGGLTAPYGLAFHGDDAYLTTCAVCAGGGSVIKVPVG